MSPDPTGFAAGDPNLYRYVGNGPTDATDPSGEDGESVSEKLKNFRKLKTPQEVQNLLLMASGELRLSDEDLVQITEIYSVFLPKPGEIKGFAEKQAVLTAAQDILVDRFPQSLEILLKKLGGAALSKKIAADVKKVEGKVNKLIPQLLKEGIDPEKRDAISLQLEKLGPGIIPVLKAYIAE